MIRFVAKLNAADNGTDTADLVYDESGQSFLVAMPRGREWHSILVNDLELHIDAVGRVLYVDGYEPREG